MGARLIHSLIESTLLSAIFINLRCSRKKRRSTASLISSRVNNFTEAEVLLQNMLPTYRIFKHHQLEKRTTKVQDDPGQHKFGTPSASIELLL
ncbi:hypothetical protein L596_006443 [Steinernema carpocapsae]|uniref:Uncharacterized protein n=1 Tax=Steinernema carpocapsae TaxID=34508 RepID=A0A4U8V223_STECR|nr:hypothetical protein L596_006443 [Steinernema carpocapsae]